MIVMIVKGDFSQSSCLVDLIMALFPYTVRVVATPDYVSRLSIC